MTTSTTRAGGPRGAAARARVGAGPVVRGLVACRRVRGAAPVDARHVVQDRAGRARSSADAAARPGDDGGVRAHPAVEPQTPGAAVVPQQPAGGERGTRCWWSWSRRRRRTPWPGWRSVAAGAVRGHRGDAVRAAGFVFLIPNYLIVNRLDWLDTLWALIVPGAAGAFGVFFLRQFFLTLPVELEEAALIDGANRWQIFTQVVLPLARPALATLARAVVPRQLERLPLAGVRAVQPRAAHAASRDSPPCRVRTRPTIRSSWPAAYWPACRCWCCSSWPAVRHRGRARTGLKG